MGVMYGGFLSRCQGCTGDGAGCVPVQTDYDAIRACVSRMCDIAFGAGATAGSNGSTYSPELLESCRWFVEWFEAADNPQMRYRRVACPAQLIIRSGMG